MPSIQDKLTCALSASTPPAILSTINALAGQNIFKRGETTSTIDSFKSWDTCMDNHVCKIVVIVLIVVGALLFIWLFGGLLRCMCCGVTTASSLFCCLSSMCSCCSGNDHHRQQAPPPPPPPAPYYNNVGYQQAPAMNSDIYTRNHAGPDLASAPLPSQVYNRSDNNPLYTYGEERFGSDGELARKEKDREEEKAKEQLQRLKIRREIYEEQKAVRRRKEEELQRLQTENSSTSNQFETDKLPENIMEANQHAYNRANNLASPTEDHLGEPAIPFNVINTNQDQSSYPVYQGQYYQPYNNKMNNLTSAYGNNNNAYEMQNLTPRNPFEDQNLQGITAFNPEEYLQQQQKQGVNLPDVSKLVTSENSNIMYPKNTEILTGMKEASPQFPTAHYDTGLYDNSNNSQDIFRFDPAKGQQNTMNQTIKPYNTSMMYPSQPPSDSDLVRKSIRLSEVHTPFDSEIQSPASTRNQSPSMLRNSGSPQASSQRSTILPGVQASAATVHDQGAGEITASSPLIGSGDSVSTHDSSSRNSLYVSPLFGGKKAKTRGVSGRFSNVPAGAGKSKILEEDHESGAPYDESDYAKTPLMASTSSAHTTTTHVYNEANHATHLPYPSNDNIL